MTTVRRRRDMREQGRAVGGEVERFGENLHGTREYI
jgi:hypothetical protein